MKKILFTAFFMLIPILTFSNPQFVEGKQYKVIIPSQSVAARIETPKNKVSVVEFFSYGCPWCFHLEPSLEKWLKTKPNYVKFTRVPVVFEDGWQTYAKAYYTAEALGILDKMTPAIFNAIHVKGLDLTSSDAMQKFFMAHGTSKADFQSAYDFSPGIGMQLEEGQNLILAYHVFAVPTIIVNGKYYTNAELTNGNDQLLMQVVNYLVEKEKPKSLIGKK